MVRASRRKQRSPGQRCGARASAAAHDRQRAVSYVAVDGEQPELGASDLGPAVINIAPIELEETLLRHPSVRTA